MKVKRIVANIAAENVAAAESFYRDLPGLESLMDMGWIQTWGNESKMTTQLSVMSEGGSGMPVPDISIDVDAALARMRAAGVPIEYGPAGEPWGVRRFYVRDPFGRPVNILQHA